MFFHSKLWKTLLIVLIFFDLTSNMLIHSQGQTLEAVVVQVDDSFKQTQYQKGSDVGGVGATCSPATSTSAAGEEAMSGISKGGRSWDDQHGQGNTSSPPVEALITKLVTTTELSYSSVICHNPAPRHVVTMSARLMDNRARRRRNKSNNGVVEMLANDKLPLATSAHQWATSAGTSRSARCNASTSMKTDDQPTDNFLTLQECSIPTLAFSEPHRASIEWLKRDRANPITVSDL